MLASPHHAFGRVLLAPHATTMQPPVCHKTGGSQRESEGAHHIPKGAPAIYGLHATTSFAGAPKKG